MNDEKSASPCLGPRPLQRGAVRPLPGGAWDMHFHVLGPQSRFAYDSHRKYTPPDAPLGQALAFHEGLGIDRGLVVHANTHGFDNEVDLDAVDNSGGRYLCVVRLDGSATRDGCKALHGRGARGVRFAFNPQHGGTLDLKTFDHVHRCIEGLGWFVELHFEGDALPELEPWIASIPSTVVIDHFGRIDPAGGMDQEPVRALLRLAGKRHVWVKLSGADRMTSRDGSRENLVSVAHRLVDIAEDRLVWGSDWPHTGIFDPKLMPDDAALVDLLFDFVPDRGQLERVLVTNPVRLLAA